MAHNDLSLTTAIINLVAPTGIVVGFAKDLLKWLSRQGVDEGAFAECARLSKGLAYPNSNGSKIQTSVVAADEKLRNLRNVPLGLIYSGALGRLMLKDPDYCYMVSTVATLIRHHDVEYAKAALTSMILDQGGHEIECKPKYHVQRAPVKAVISKIVESAHLNVTNPGHHCELLPPELEALHAHCVDDTTFAGTAMAIQRSDSDMMLSTARFPADVVLWILNHFEGTMIVYLGNEELFSKKLGSSQRTLRVLIQERCADDPDGLGASDISGDFGPSDAVEAAMAVLGEVMFDELVRWDTWFKVGACAVTGCGWRTTTDVTEEEGGSCWIAVQYGSLVAATPWYDLSFDVGMRNCFTMILYEGTLKGITDELAFLLTEQTTPAEAGDTGPSQSTVFTSDNSTLVEQHKGL
ncbi:hypothetical protein MBLNU459_g5321t3 [Dothideomycetes sp. NU459]